MIKALRGLRNAFVRFLCKKGGAAPFRYSTP